MIRKMKQKFVAVVLLTYIILIVIVISAIDIFSHIQTNRKYDQMLEILITNNGEFPDPDEYEKKTYIDFGNEFNITVESKFENRYFLVLMDNQGEYIESELSHIAAVSESDAKLYASKVYKQMKVGDSKKGTYQMYRYLIKKTKDGYLTAFVDISQQIANMTYVRTISIGISMILLLILLFIVSKISGPAVRPLVENMEKQKRFITDAGHELKTPLAVISANADVLELTCGKNQWIDSIRNQTKQLDELVKRLLFLSKMEEGQQLVMVDFDLSSVVMDKVQQISAIAISQEKTFETDIQPDIHYKGDADAIAHMVSVLTENAVKYCEENGRIAVKLVKTGKNIHFEVQNTSEPLEEQEMNRLFERFYRPDTSRTRETGGHGIGLSIAKAVAISHKGKIYAKNEPDNMVAFCVEL